MGVSSGKEFIKWYDGDSKTTGIKAVMKMQEKLDILMNLYIQEIKKIYGEHLCKIILYGSYARGEFKPLNQI